MNFTAFIKTAVAIVGALLLSASAPADDVVLIKAQTLHTGTGKVFAPGSVLVKDGKIVKVGKSIKAKGAKVIKVETVIPGLIDAANRIGISGVDDERTEELTPDMAAASIVDWNDRDFREELVSGTTSIHLTPGTANVVGGLAAAVKTAGPLEDRIIADRTGLTIAVCSDPASGNGSRSRPDSIYNRQPTNRMGVVWMLRNAFHAAKSGKPSSDVMKEAAEGGLPIFAVSRTHYDINTLMTLADEFSFQPILIGGQECWKLTDELAQRKMAVVLQRGIPGSSRGSERTRVNGNMAGQLNSAGVPFCLSGGDLLEQLRFAVRFGLPADEALAAVTSSPAKILKIDKRVGSIAAGKDADIVALNGDPLEFTTAVQWVMVDGAIEYEQAGK